MTNSPFDELFEDFERFFTRTPFVGFDNFASELSQLTGLESYPPHNVVKASENSYAVQVACAGFSAAELSVEVYGTTLRIAGAPALEDKVESYIHKGIARREFLHEFRLRDGMTVGTPVIQNGLLSVPVTYEIPNEDKPRVLEIVDVANTEPVDEK